MSDVELISNEDDSEAKRLGRFVLLILNTNEPLILIDSSLMCLVKESTIRTETHKDSSYSEVFTSIYRQ